MPFLQQEAKKSENGNVESNEEIAVYEMRQRIVQLEKARIARESNLGRRDKMSEVNIDSIRIEAKTNIKEAISDIEALKQSLTGLGDNKSGIDHYSTSVNGLTQRLTKLTGITNKAGIAAVEKSVRELAEASIKLNNLQLNEKKGSIFSEDTWKRAMENVESAMENVKNTIAQNVKEIRQLDGVEKAFDNYIKKARNIKIPIGVKMT